jgi:hypothetical protein
VAQAKEPLAAIEPGKRVTLAVELGKLQLVQGAAAGASVVVLGSSMASRAGTTAIMQRVLRASKSQLQSNLLLALLYQCGRELRHLIVHGLQGCSTASIAARRRTTLRMVTSGSSSPSFPEQELTEE